MELSERKKQILKAIIGDYIRTAEPVGSKALTEGHELPFSSATIRNEMSELEDMGYLEKPHTSAGRIPSPQGYRLYVDELMERPTDNAEDGNALQNSVLTKVRELDHLIQEAGKLLTSLTNYASVAITPTNDGKVLRLVFPQLTEDRRKELCKEIKKLGEECKVAVRNVRRDSIEKLKAKKKASELTEDEVKDGEKQIQDVTDKYVAEIDKMVSEKDKEIMSI